MAIIYIVIVLVIIVIDIDQLPGVIALVFKSAFNMEAGFGAVFGLAVQWCKRGFILMKQVKGQRRILPAANVSHPTKQGLVQSFSVYIDTLLVCSATGFMLLITVNTMSRIPC
jgi:AGCS family alanine or glycine:cation symporter